MIYFAQLPSGSVKIGCSGDVDSRLQSLASHYRQPVALLHTMEGDRHTEREIHERFDHLRIRRTEQFRPGPDLMEFIGKPLLVSQNPDAVEAVEIEPELKLIRLELTPEYHRLLRIAAAEDGSNMSLMARQYVMDALDRRKKGAK